jgi:hypothetical protein
MLMTVRHQPAVTRSSCSVRHRGSKEHSAVHPSGRVHRRDQAVFSRVYLFLQLTVCTEASNGGYAYGWCLFQM